MNVTTKIARVAVALALAGCGDEPATPEAEACRIEAPTLLLAETTDWGLEQMFPTFSFQIVGDRLLLRYAPASWWNEDIYLRDLCGGEPELVLDGEQGFVGAFVRESSVGPVLFAERSGEAMVAIDRIAEPGIDAPRPIAGIPMQTEDLLLYRSDHGEGGIFFEQLDRPYAPGVPRGAAGLGAVTTTVWDYSGEPDDDAALLASDVIRYRPEEGTPRVLVHTDDGRLRWIDRETRGEAAVRDGVRWFGWYPIEGRPYLVIQEIADGKTEPVLLRDVETGQERPVTVNPFADMSFGQDPQHPSAGRIYGGVVLGLYGPDGTLVEAYDHETLAPLAIPEHVGLSWIDRAPAVGLVLADPVDHVLALWDPRTGAVTEWFRGATAEADAIVEVEWRDGVLRVYSRNADESLRIAEVDPATGASKVLLPRLQGTVRWLDEERLIHTLTVDPEAHTSKVVLSDLATGVSRELVARTRRVAYHEARGLLLYTDREAATPGLWAMPVR